MSSYTIITSSLYFLSYLAGERLQELPVYMAYTLLRILFAFNLVATICLSNGLKLEYTNIDSLKASEDSDELSY